MTGWPGRPNAPHRAVAPAAGDYRLGQPDESVVVGVTPVDDGRLVGFLAVEQEEVVADELHFVERVVGGHGRGGVLLGPHDPTGFVVLEAGPSSSTGADSGSTRWVIAVASASETGVLSP